LACHPRKLAKNFLVDIARRYYRLSGINPDPFRPLIKDASVWVAAIRPRTLTLAIVPVLVGIAMAVRDGAIGDFWLGALTLACAVLIQAGTNLFNDASDAERGNDGPDRLGPDRVTAGGRATAGQVKRSAWLLFGVALVGGLYLAYAGGWPILAIGLASLAAGWAYSGGPRPLAYTAWGELFVVVFFGLAAVGGSYYLQRGSLSFSVLGVGMALGLHAAAVLLLNNLRDHDSDRRAGRRTLVHVTGTGAAYWLYALLLLGPFPVLAMVLYPSDLNVAWVALPVCAWLVWRCMRLSPSAAMNVQLGLTAFAQVLLGSLLSIALYIDPV
jgi:1,4-dihydroxy-2-naphthoate octaprenyltransferase